MKTGRRGAPQAFARKLYEILEVESSDYITWNETGTAFIIVNLDTFTELILMKYFRHQKFPSFQRQLNLYGFRKITRGPDTGAYAHKFFVRDRPDLLDYVRRAQMAPHNHQTLFQNDLIYQDHLKSLVKVDHSFPPTEDLSYSRVLSFPYDPIELKDSSHMEFKDSSLNMENFKIAEQKPETKLVEQRPAIASSKKSHWCLSEGCNRLPLFGYQSQRALYCNEHRKIGMVNIYEFLGSQTLQINNAGSLVQINNAGSLMSYEFALSPDKASSKAGCLHLGCSKSADVVGDYCSQHRFDLLLQAATSI